MIFKNFIYAIILCSTLNVQASFFEKKATRRRRVAYHACILTAGILSGAYWIYIAGKKINQKDGILKGLGTILNDAFTMNKIDTYPFLSGGVVSAFCVYKGFNGLRKELRL